MSDNNDGNEVGKVGYKALLDDWNNRNHTLGYPALAGMYHQISNHISII